MGPWTLTALLLTALLVGVLIGATGIGGLLLPPALIYVGGLAAHTAAATSCWAFLLTGLGGTAAYARTGSLSWRTAAWLVLGAVPGAALGAWSNGLLPAGALSAALGAVVLLGGLSALRRGVRVDGGSRALGAVSLAGLGAGVGFGSGLTGTGGPVLLIPVLLLAGVPPLVAVGAGQAIQLPIAAAASTTYLLHGDVDVGLGSVLGIVALGGVVAGAWLSRALPVERLRRVLGVLLVVVGAAMLARTLW